MRTLDFAGRRYLVTWHGLVSDAHRRRGEAPGYDEPPEEAAVEVCTQWLALFAKATKVVTHPSYHLHQLVEAWHGDYIPNGAMIEAALRAGFRVEPDGPYSPNCHIYLGYDKRLFSRLLLSRRSTRQPTQPDRDTLTRQTLHFLLAEMVIAEAEAPAGVPSALRLVAGSDVLVVLREADLEPLLPAAQRD